LPAAQLFADDMKSAEEIFGKKRRTRSDRKTQQLCRQVERTIGLALAAGCGDPILLELTVASVVPAPDASRLLVSVYQSLKTSPTLEMEAEEPFQTPNTSHSVFDIYERLEGVRGILRREVAEAITRKRAPELLFRVIAGGEVQP
jgi:ribosome-binding factor A